MMPAETFPLWSFIEDELQARGWTVADLQGYSGLTDAQVAALRRGSRLELRTAEVLSRALGVNSATLLSLDMAHRRNIRPAKGEKESR